MKFKKKPVVIEAMRFDKLTGSDFLGSFVSARTIEEWSGKTAYAESYHPVDGWCSSMRVRTLEGYMTAMPGDWIIKGIKGEFYPCKPDIFEQTYEPVEPTL